MEPKSHPSQDFENVLAYIRSLPQSPVILLSTQLSASLEQQPFTITRNLTNRLRTMHSLVHYFVGRQFVEKVLLNAFW